MMKFQAYWKLLKNTIGRKNKTKQNTKGGKCVTSILRVLGMMTDNFSRTYLEKIVAKTIVTFLEEEIYIMWDSVCGD